MKMRFILSAASGLVFLADALSAATLYVDLNSPNPAPPYADWSTAATNIQDAIDAATDGDLVLVTNGIYASGGKQWYDSGSNRVTMTKSIVVQSVNGPAATIIQGIQALGTNAMRCVLLQNTNAMLAGFTLTGGQGGTGNYFAGGGVWCSSSGDIISNCIIAGNLAGDGGGAYRGTLINCKLIGNVAAGIRSAGGGAYNSTAINCLIVSNTADDGGGACSGTFFSCTIVENIATNLGGGVYYNATVNNSIVYFNSAPNGANLSGVKDNYSCSFPTVFDAHSITNEPLFVNPAGGDFHLQSDSPCINAGNNGYVTNYTDLDGKPRIVDGMVDIGSYELQPSPPTHFVSLTSANPMPPYSSWDTAATNIQDAIDVATNGDLVLVTNGVYASGGRVVYGTLTNRVVINKAITVQSVNGPDKTIIQGYQIPGSQPNGDSAIRCVYMTNNATLSGFSLIGGATRLVNSGIAATQEASGGGIWCESTNAYITNCFINTNVCYNYGPAIYSGTLDNCQIFYNTNASGSGISGGAAYSVLINSAIQNNYCRRGASGAYFCVLSNCLVSQNFMGVQNCWLDDCILENNTNITSFNPGGGASQSTLNHCTIRNNWAVNGGGAFQCELNSCVVSNNYASISGGGVYEVFTSTNQAGTNTLVIGNLAEFTGGGVFVSGINTNWIFSGWSFASNSAAQYGGGICLQSASCLISDCTFTGNSAGGNGGGLGWFRNLTSGFSTIVSNSIFNGNIARGTNGSQSGLGGGAYAAFLYNCSVTGNQAVNGGGLVGVAYNCTISSNTASSEGGGIQFLSPGSFGPTSVMTNNVLTGNSAYNGGGVYNGVFSNCTFYANYAISNGGGVSSAALNHCFIINNHANLGGGVSGESAQIYPGIGPFTCIDCVISSNTASMLGGGINSVSARITNCIVKNNSAGSGGGIAGGIIIYNSIIWDNFATTNGGGGYNSTFYDSLIVSNTADKGGGLYGGQINNSTATRNTATDAGGGCYAGSGNCSIIYGNFAPIGADFSGNSIFSYCCSSDFSSPDTGHITNDPVFINPDLGDFRLQTNSHCIDVVNTFAGGIDLDGRPRIVNNKIDMGAYEFQEPRMGEFIFWLEQHGLPKDGSVDDVDSDGDGLNNWQEWIVGTNPTNAFSVLKILTTNNPVAPSGHVVAWQSVSNITYFVQSSTNLAAQPPFSTIQSDIPGQEGTTTYVDTSATNDTPYFYRVGAQE